MAVFPPGDITVLDDFGRSDGAVYAGAGSTLWGTTKIDGSSSGLVVSSGVLTGGSECLTSESVADLVRSVRISTAAGGAGVWIAYRLTGSPGSMSGYVMGIAGTTITLYKLTGGSASVVGTATLADSLSTNIRFSVQAVGSAHKVWLGFALPTRDTAVATFTDGTFTSAGKTALGMDSGWAMDDFWSGGLTAPTSAVTIHVDPDHADSSDSYTRTQASSASTPMRTIQAAGFLARADTTWADTIQVSVNTGTEFDASPFDSLIQPALDYRSTDRSSTAVGWVFGDNSGNLPITVKGAVTVSDLADVQSLTLPKLLGVGVRGLTNWVFEGLQVGYDVGSGHDYKTLSPMERVTDLTFRKCLFTGGIGIVQWWADAFTVDMCVIHAKLPPDGGSSSFHDGAGIRFESLPGEGTGYSVGQLTVTGCLFDGVRGDDAINVGGVGPLDPLYDDFDCVIEGNTFINVTEVGEGGNPTFHCDSIQFLTVPRATIRRNVFIGCSDAVLCSDGVHGVITIEANLTVGIDDPFQFNSGVAELVFRNNTCNHADSAVKDSSLLFFTRDAALKNTLATITNNHLGGFFMRDAPGSGLADKIAAFFHDDSVIEANTILATPGLVTVFGTNLARLPEYGHSDRLDVIPNDTIFYGEIDRNWDLATSPITSPGIGQGDATDLGTDLLGRSYTDPPDVGCLQSDPGTLVTPAPRPPYVLSRSPSPGASGVAVDTGYSAVLFPVPGASIDPGTVDASSFFVTGPSGTHLPVASVSVSGPDGEGEFTVLLAVQGVLLPWVVYTVSLTGAVEDSSGSPVTASSWSFRAAGVDPAVGVPEGEPDPESGSVTISSRWPVGTVVGVFPAVSAPAGVPSGPAVASGTVSGSSMVGFTGLTPGVRYLAYALGIGVAFLVPLPVFKRVRVS